MNFILPKFVDRLRHKWSTRKIRSLTPDSDDVFGVAITPDGKHALSAGGDKKIRIWDLKSGKFVRAFRIVSSVNTVAVTPDGQFAMTTSSHSGCVELWDIKSGRKVRRERYPGQPKGLAITPNGQYALIASYYNIFTFGIKTDPHIQFKNKLSMYNMDVAIDVAITSDMQYAVTAYADSILRVWDVNLGEEIHTLRGHQDTVLKVIVTPNNQFAISGSKDESLKIWDIKAGEEVKTLTGHVGSVRGIAAFSDNRHIVSASYDGTIRIWDLHNNSQIATFSVDASLYCCAISPDNSIIVAGDEHGRVHFLDTSRLNLPSS